VAAVTRAWLTPRSRLVRDFVAHRAILNTSEGSDKGDVFGCNRPAANRARPCPGARARTPVKGVGPLGT
jgi:hypothetical protein